MASRPSLLPWLVTSIKPFSISNKMSTIAVAFKEPFCIHLTIYVTYMLIETTKYPCALVMTLSIPSPHDPCEFLIIYLPCIMFLLLNIIHLNCLIVFRSCCRSNSTEANHFRVFRKKTKAFHMVSMLVMEIWKTWYLYTYCDGDLWYQVSAQQ